jgi:lambda family phage minor tail protein L
MSTIVSALQGVDPGTIIELYQLELNATQHDINLTNYFHAGVNEIETAIVWQTNTYQALPIKAEGFQWEGEGSLPRPKLLVANVLGTITNALLSLPSGLEGAKVTRIRTLARYLDAVNFSTNTNPTADPTAEWPREIYYVDRKAAETRDVVEFELASAFDLAAVRAPKRQCVARCQWVYRSPECSYAGTVYFDANDNPVASPALDVCGKRVTSCEKRFTAFFAQYNLPLDSLPFGGYPGIGTFFV